MRTLEIKIRLGNAAFNPLEGPEVALILRDLADNVERFGSLDGYGRKLRDTNGNTVGEVTLKGGK